jgi:thioredoxin reductase (NADPH)
VPRKLPVSGGGSELPRAPRGVLLVAHKDPALARAIEVALRRAFYRQGFEVACTNSGALAFDLLRRVRDDGKRTAVVVADHDVAELDAIELVEAVRDVSPDTRTVLLVELAQTRVAIEAVNAGTVDYFMVKPLLDPDAQLVPAVSDLLEDWSRWSEEVDRSVRIVGPSASERVHDLRDFLTRAQIHHRFLDVQRDPEARQLLSGAASGAIGLPVVVLTDGTTLVEPSRLTLAEALGLSTRPLRGDYDLLIVGGGPAGLAGAVYGASEGLRTALIERDAPGGQAGQSSRIENYLGFPSGVTGADLAQRAFATESPLQRGGRASAGGGGSFV